MRCRSTRARLRVPSVRLWPNHVLRGIEDELDLDTRLALQRVIHLDRLVCQGAYEPLIRDGVAHLPLGLRQRPDHIAVGLGWWMRALAETGARRTGRDYAREVRDHALACGYIVDSGEHDSPRGPGRYKQTGNCRWWPTYLVPLLMQPMPSGAYGSPLLEPVLPKLSPAQSRTAQRLMRTASLWRIVIRQAERCRPRRPSECRRGSVQWAFANAGPP